MNRRSRLFLASLVLFCCCQPGRAQDQAPAPIAFTTAGGDIGGHGAFAKLFAARGRRAADISSELAAGRLPLDGVAVLIIGSYTNAGPTLATLRAHREVLAAWLAAGGVLVELAQQDSGYPRTDWLPGGLLASRADPDYASVTWLRTDHPLAHVPHQLDDTVLGGWRLRNWSIAWEALTSWDGFECIAACGPTNSQGAVIEAAYGKGRVIISQISPDTMYLSGEGDTPAKAEKYFDNLLAYLDVLVAGRGVDLRPTPALGAVAAAELGGAAVALLGEADSALARMLGAQGVQPVPLDQAAVAIVAAGAAEGLSEATVAALAAFAEAGGVVVELAQNQRDRPVWLNSADRAVRGGHPGDFTVPAVPDHPLYRVPNRLEGTRRTAWREGATPVAAQPFAGVLGWGVVSRYGGETSPPAVIERAVGAGRVILVAADPAAAAGDLGLVGDNARAFLANLLTYAAAARRNEVALAPPLALPDRAEMWVGRQLDGSVMVPVDQLLTPAGIQVEFPGRPTDLALLPGTDRLLVADRNHLRVIDAGDGELLHSVAAGAGHAFCGLVVKADGKTAYSSTANGQVQVWSIDDTGKPSRGEPLVVPGGNPANCGLALSADEQTLYIAASRANAVMAMPLAGGQPREIPVGIAPFDLLRLGNRLLVSNWGGRRPSPGARTAETSGSQVMVDERTTAISGSVSIIDLGTLEVAAEVEVGLLPCGLAASPDGRLAYVACSNSDTVAVIDPAAAAVVETIAVKPSERLPFGSGVNDLVVSPDGRRLYAACGTNNAVAVVELSQTAGGSAAVSRVLGFIPVGWYPGAVALSDDGKRLCAANTKGVGSLAQATRHNSHHHQGSVSLIDLDATADLEAWTAQAASNNSLSRALAGLEPPRADVPAVPLPERHGEPSLLKHVVYIIRENRTYDQVMGDMPQGNGDPSLVHFGREVTPNSHALAEEFQLLDNFYCSGILSADGHQWTNEGYVTSYLEKAFGGFVRSYPYEGNDALAAAPSGYIWDNVLAHGLTFRSYGEMVQGHVQVLTEGKRPIFKEIYDDFVADGKLDHYRVYPSSHIAAVRDNMCPTTIGFPSNVPDIYRADQFIRELREFERTGSMPNFCIMLLPNDHTAGTRPDYPTPRAAVADNDLAVGQIVEAITHSRFWPETAIFICQDDPQAGVDHVDGHRSPAFVISPYTPRGKVVSTNYTQVGMLKTIELILGLPPMNQLDLAARPMRDCFSNEADLTPFVARPNEIPLDEMNPPLSALSGRARYWAELSMAEDLDEVDEADEDTLNQILWHYCKGYDTPYPRWALLDPEKWPAVGTD